jgi:hypothetical protein
VLPLSEGQKDKGWVPSKIQRVRQKIVHFSKLSVVFIGVKHVVNSVTTDFLEAKAKFWLQKFEEHLLGC